MTPIKTWLCLALALPVAGCHAKEAEDPQKILGDLTEHGGVDGTVGARGKTEPRSQKAQQPAESLATKTECAAAGRRIEELALELAVKQAEDAAERAELEKRRAEVLKSAAHRDRIAEAADECLSRDTSQREAVCIAKARTELDVDRCSRGR